MPSKFSSANPIGSITRWQPAQTGLARCRSMRSRSDSTLPSRAAFRQRRDVRRRRLRRHAEQIGQNPLAALDRRRAIRIRGDGEDAGLAEQAAARLVRRPARAGTGCRRCWECRSAAPAARSRTCSRRSADPSTLRSSRMMLSKNSSVSSFIACRRLSSKSGKAPRSGLEFFRLRRCSHCSAKLSIERLRSRIGQHPPDLLLEHRRLLQLALRSPASAAARREGCSTGRTTAATPARGRPSR